jgi:hypothetical protein
MPDAEAMHPARWRATPETMPRSYRKPAPKKEPEMTEDELCHAMKMNAAPKACQLCGISYRLWSYHAGRCSKRGAK